MSLDKPEEDIPSQFFSMDTEKNKDVIEEADESAAFRIAQHVLEATDAGFVIVGSPVVAFSEHGQPFPNQIGISINADTPFSKSTLAPVLRLLANNLEEDTNRISEFLREAQGQ